MAWEHDKLERAKSARFLTDYLSRLYSTNQADHYVLAIDSEWGGGKTYLLKNWQNDLEEEGYPVIYFDAWENDFSDDPLIAVIADLHEKLKPYFGRLPSAEKAIIQMKRNAGTLIKGGVKVLVNALSKQVIGLSTDTILDAFTNDNTDDEDNTDDDQAKDSAKTGHKAAKQSLNKTIDKLTEIAFKEHSSKKHGITKFKQSLELLLDSLKGAVHEIKLPMFILVDELDRCRPDYAVELLEAIKHLFGVPGVFFVIATNMEQLAHSVGVLYGDGFDSRRYLKRFFHQEYVLPDADNTRFAAYLFDQYRILENISNEQVYSVLDPRVYPDTPHIHAFALLSSGFLLSLRDQEQVAANVRAVVITANRSKRLHLFYLLFLVILRHKSKQLFDAFCDGSEEEKNAVVNKIYPENGRQFGVHSTNRNGSKEGVSIRDLIGKYIELAWMDGRFIFHQKFSSTVLPDAIGYEIQADYPAEMNLDIPYPSELRNYPNWVAQAGQLA